jgi:hypothetical protein
MALARSILNEVIDGNRVPRKALADEIGKTETAFSKMLGGVQAFDVDDVGSLPRDIQIAWVKRYGAEVLGLTVTELSVVDAAVAVMEAFTALQARMRTLETVNPRMAKAELPAAERKRTA